MTPATATAAARLAVDALAGLTIDSIPHAELLAACASRAKAVVRRGVRPLRAVRSGVDVPACFSRPGVVVPDYYRDRMPGGGSTTS